MQAELTHVVLPSMSFPLYTDTVACGFPSPAEDYIETEIDMNDYLIEHPAATFFLRVSGESMVQAGIFHNDLIVVDSSKNPHNGDIVVAEVDGGFTVKTYRQEGERIFLVPANPDYDPIEVTEAMEAVVWGVVTYALHKPHTT